MFSYKGFTLIELLIVVLIIGILAAVAVPQYQQAVTRSRFATLKNLTTSLVKAQEVYYLAHDEYATNFSDLDIQLPFQRTEGMRGYFEGGYCWLTSQGKGRTNQVGCVDSSVRMTYQEHLLHSTSSTKGCTVLGTKNTNCSTVQCKVCQRETGKMTANTAGTNSTDTDWVLWWY